MFLGLKWEDCPTVKFFVSTFCQCRGWKYDYEGCNSANGSLRKCTRCGREQVLKHITQGPVEFMWVNGKPTAIRTYWSDIIN